MRLDTATPCCTPSVSDNSATTVSIHKNTGQNSLACRFGTPLVNTMEYTTMQTKTKKRTTKNDEDEEKVGRVWRNMVSARVFQSISR
ncbi:predicted protein [Plenodomus lingam JN3]|uniref:Predicted protein n=1 Tax=Leptosphaeria maculans (strain JN3 / isolate v23.1.3 / race Av1-4-5-6-7-8) TaxID=985895 RepID=E4ZPS4_LEPMJ|nr:predicted protein [Plenodomus lingam JN3]CBX93459.1 predicted protein [Plenodomus lingam JN3]